MSDTPETSGTPESPTKTFGSPHNEPTPDSGLTFSVALERLKHGAKITRAGWNGRDMYLFLVDGAPIKAPQEGESMIYKIDAVLEPHIVMKTVQDAYIPWLASQADLLSDDWLLA